MISKYLHLVSSTKSQITIFILLNICGLIFFLLPHNIFSNMLDLELFFTVKKMLLKISAQWVLMVEVFTSYLHFFLDTVYPILYLSLFLGAYFKLFRSSKAILLVPITAFSFDILENLQITRLNLNFPNINETHVYLSSMTTSLKWIAIAITVSVLIYGIIKRRKK